ncbi:hypothetical protein L6R52_39745 [Myxococcota bacterium]|nr:hypothetical protein [Myxococcota bacterium]
MTSHAERAVTFRATDDPRFPYEATVGTERWRVRIDEFPETPSLYTLFVDDVEVLGLVDWPRAWARPDGQR